MLDALLKIGFLTGSRAFGTAQKDSDWDIVYSVKDTQRIRDVLGNIPTTPSDYFSGYFVEVEGEKLNLIPVHPDEYQGWKVATEAMTAILQVVKVDLPADKYAIFSGIRALVSGRVRDPLPVTRR